MAAQKTAKKSDETLILPPIASRPFESKRNSGKTLGNFGSYVLLPSLDPVQQIHAIYDVRKFCKILCDWYVTWRSWQREVLLCSLSEKCSVNLLTSLSTVLEPVFHRDFVSRLHGKYPDFRPRVTKVSKRGKIRTFRCEHKGNNSKAKVKSRLSKACIAETTSDATKKEKDKKKSNQTKSTNDKVTLKEPDDKAGKQEHEIPTKQVEAVADEEVENQISAENHVSSLTNLIKESLSKDNNGLQNIMSPRNDFENEMINQALVENVNETFECRSCHTHTAAVYNQETGSRFFSASRFKKLSDMKANFGCASRSDFRPGVGGQDQKCFKHRQWWSADPKGKQLVPAEGLNLWKYFTRQLNEIDERMESWGDHDRVSVISEVLKSSDPEQINFFAQCLIQRLKDDADVTILPDQILLKIFSKLGAKTLCKISQVSRRWRYLAEDDGLWKDKCHRLGLLNGVSNLIFLIETSAEERSVDWKQAYREVYMIFQQSKKQKRSPVEEQEDEEFEVLEPTESCSTSSIFELSQTPSENGRISEQRLISEGVTEEILFEYLDLSPNADSEFLSGSGGAKDDDDADLTGGNLGMLEDTLSEMTGEKQEDTNDEIAYDVRPNKVQPLNEMEDLEDADLITVGVEDVKSVKRVRKLQVRKPAGKNGHMDGVYTVQFDTKRCLTGSTDRLLRMWDVRSGRAIKTMAGHLGGVRCAQFDNEKIISGSWDTTMMVWDIVKFTCTRILHGHQACVSCLRFNSTHLVSGSHDMTARVWDMDTWECLHVLEGHTDEVNCLFLGGVYLLTGSADKTVKLWNTETGECMKTLLGHNTSVLSLQACRALVISGSEDGKIMFWDVEQGSPVAIIQAHAGPCNCLFVWGSHFLSGGGDSLVKQWDISTMTCLRTLQGHKRPVQSVKMSWSKIVSSSEDGTVRIWDLEAPIHKLGRQYDEFENSLLPFATVEHDEETSVR